MKEGGQIWLAVNVISQDIPRSATIGIPTINPNNKFKDKKRFQWMESQHSQMEVLEINPVTYAIKEKGINLVPSFIDVSSTILLNIRSTIISIRMWLK